MKRLTNRRDFLKSSALLTAGVLGAPAIATAANKGDKIKLAVIGAGGQGRSGMNSARGQQLVAVADADLDGRAGKNLANAKKQFPDLKTYSDYRKLFDAHKDLDAVWVATPDHTHFPAAIRALDRGIAVYCEKPLTHEIFEARKLREIAIAKKIPTQMGNQGHAGESIRRIVEYIHAGTLGEITQLHCVSNRSFSASKRPATKPVPKGLDWESWIGPAPQRPYHDGLHPFSWRGWLDFGTGSIGDMACHTIDGAVWALKLTDAPTIEVTTEAGSVNTEGYSRAARIVYTFGARGDLKPITLTWWNGGGKDNLPPRPPQIGAKDKIISQGAYYYGTKGLMSSGSHCQSPRLYPDSLRKAAKVDKTLPRVPGHSGDFFRAITDSSAPAPSSHFGYSAGLTEIVLLGTLSLNLPGQKLIYDAKAGRFTNNDKANALIKRPPRKGWEYGYDL